MRHLADGRPPAFVDETSGLYGTPLAGNEMLLGLPVDSWDVDPDWPAGDPETYAEVSRWLERRFPGMRPERLLRRVIAADSYAASRTLTLAPVRGTSGTVLTFAGGSGGSIKTVLAASRRAAVELTNSGIPSAATWSRQPRTLEGTLL